MAALDTGRVVGVIGAGAMGAGIAQVAAAAGHRVLLYDVRHGSAPAGKARVAASLDKAVERGRMGAGDADDLLDRIAIADDLDPLAEASLFIEAIVEEADPKRRLYRDLEDIAAPDAIIATNTSSLSVTDLASELKRPESFAGMHFFNPAPQMPLVEIVRGEKTSEETIATLADTARAWGKTAVIARDAPGFIVNKGARPFYGEALKLLEEGAADVPTIDSLLRAAGFRMGPFEIIDLVGLDVNLATSKTIWEAYDRHPRYAPSLLVEERVEQGLLGRKTSEGFYSYREATDLEPSVLPPSAAPLAVTVNGELGPAQALIGLWQAKGFDVGINRSEDRGWVEADGICLALTDGRTAAQRRSDDGGEWVLFDLSVDYAVCPHLAVAAESRRSATQAAGLFQALGMKVSQVEDLPGLVVARTVAMLINEASDTLEREIATAEDIDLAMEKGLSYPGGPLAWCERLGCEFVVRILDNMQASGGGRRYEASDELRRRAGTEDPINA